MNELNQPDVIEIDTSHRKHAVIAGILFIILCILLYYVFAVLKKPDVSLKGTLNKKSTESMGTGTGSPKISSPDDPDGGGGAKNSVVIPETPKPIDLQSSTNPPPSLFANIDLSVRKGPGIGTGTKAGTKHAPSKTKVLGNRGLKGRGRAMGNGATPAVFDAIDLGQLGGTRSGRSVLGYRGLPAPHNQHGCDDCDQL